MFAASHSESAREWVLAYIGSERVRSRLHPSIQNLTGLELLDRFTWEFDHLPLIHNAPVTLQDANEAAVHDDSPINSTVLSGYLQNPCIRATIGGNESIQGFSVLPVYKDFFKEMGMPDSAYSEPR